MWLVVNILLRYCLFLRSAPHRSEAKILHCTVQVLPISILVRPGCTSSQNRFTMFNKAIDVPEWGKKEDFQAG
ncbi:hypothetical protein FNL27_19585 [Salmonella enterica]|nr:hypothetical protein [Salmonella enterica]